MYRLGVLLTGDMAVFVQARDAEEYMVDDGWKAVETHRNGNGNGHEEAIAASNGHDAEAPEPEQSLFSWAEFMAEEPVKSKVRSRVLVRVGVHLGAGSGDGSGRRGALGRNTQGEVVATSAMASPCTSMCAALFCCPFSGGALIPLLRSPSSASDGPSGEVAGIEANKRRLTLDLASTLQRWLKVWRSRASACARSGQTAVDREADEGRG